MGKEKKRTVTAVSCEVCGQTIGRRADLARHMKRHAPNKDIYMNHCTYPGCKYKTLQRSNLDTHLRTHTGERPKKCPVKGCNFATGDPASLTHHRMGIHGYNPKDDSTKETSGGRQKKTRTRFSHSPYSYQSSSNSDGSGSSSQSSLNTTPSPDRFDTPFVPDRNTINFSSQDGIPEETSLAEAIKSGYAAFCTRLITDRQKANESSQSSPNTQSASPPAAASQTVKQGPATVNRPLPALEQVDPDTAKLLSRWFPLSVLDDEATATLVNNFLESFNAPRTLSVPLDATPPVKQSSNNNENVPLNFDMYGHTTGGTITASAPLNTNVYGYPNGDTTIAHAPSNTDPYGSTIGNTTEVSATTITNTYGYTVNGTSEERASANPSNHGHRTGNTTLAPASLNVGPYSGNTTDESASTDANAYYGYTTGGSGEQFVFTNMDAYGYAVGNAVIEHTSNVVTTEELTATSTNAYGLGYAAGGSGEQSFVDTNAHGHATGNTVTEHAPNVVNTAAELIPTSTNAYGYVAGGSGEQSVFVDTADAYGHATDNMILPPVPLNANLYGNIIGGEAPAPTSTNAYGYNFVGGTTQESAFVDVNAGYPIGGTNTSAYEYAIGNTTAYGQTVTDANVAHALPQVHAEQAYTFDNTAAVPAPLHQAPALNTYGYAMNDMASVPFSYNSLGCTVGNVPQASYTVNSNPVTLMPQFTGQETGHYQTYPVVNQNSTYEAAPEASDSLAQGFYMY